MNKPTKKRALTSVYVSPNQGVIPGFETPFTQKLDPNNRWILLSKCIPWDSVVSTYNRQLSNSKEGRPHLNGRLVIGALFIKYLNNWDDRETILQIQENMYLQYFVGLSSFSTTPIFDPSLFVEIRKRMGDAQINALNEQIVKLHLSATQPSSCELLDSEEQTESPKDEDNTPSSKITHQGRLITDATACPQDIAYPTDLGLLSDAREKTEYLIDCIHSQVGKAEKKPRTYRQKARKEYLAVAKKKNKSKKSIRKAIGKQLNYLRRNLKSIDGLLEENKPFPLSYKEQRYLLIIQTLYDQQVQMYTTHTHSIEDRIVSIHQPHVRPIVRGKANAKVEFGAKIEVTLANGFAFLDDLSWDAFNEGTRLMDYVEKYKQRFGYYPQEVLADGIFSSRENRRNLKAIGVKLIAKPLGRPREKAVKQYVSPGERNPIEGKFGQGKNAYGLGRIKARLKDTSQSWIASIILVLNLVKLAGLNTYCLILGYIQLGIYFLMDNKKLSRLCYLE